MNVALAADVQLRLDRYLEQADESVIGGWCIVGGVNLYVVFIAGNAKWRGAAEFCRTFRSKKEFNRKTIR